MSPQTEIDSSVGSDTPSTRPTAPTAGPHQAYKTYDFRRPDKFSKDQLRTLQAIHDNVARNLGARLSARLRTTVSLQLATAEQVIFDKYVSRLTLPTQLVVLRSTGLAGPILLEIDLCFALAVIERILGGQGRVPVERHEPTGIEASLIGRLVGDIVPTISEAWSHLADLPLEVVELALGPALLRVTAPSEVVAVLTYEARLFGQTTTISIVYPHGALEPMLTRLSGIAWYAQTNRQAIAVDRHATMAASLDQVVVLITAVLGAVDLPVETLTNLQPGDVIRFDERADEPVGIWIADQVRSWGLPGRIGDRLALRMVSPLIPMEARTR